MSRTQRLALILFFFSLATMGNSCKRPADPTNLVVNVRGPGMVTNNAGPRIQCSENIDSRCTMERIGSEALIMKVPKTTLTATPNPQAVFTGWSNDCVGTSNECVVELTTGNKLIFATFLQIAYDAKSASHDGGDSSISGSFYQTTDLGTGQLSSVGGVDIYLARISETDGATLWSTSFGSLSTNYVESISINSFDEIIIVGHTSYDVIHFTGASLDCTSFSRFTATLSGADGTYIAGSCLP